MFSSLLFLTFCLQEVDRTTSWSSPVILVFSSCCRKTGFVGNEFLFQSGTQCIKHPCAMSSQGKQTTMNFLSLLLKQQPKPSAVTDQHVAEMVKSQEHQDKQLRLLEIN